MNTGRPEIQDRTNPVPKPESQNDDGKSLSALPGTAGGHPRSIFGNFRFCGDEQLDVQCLLEPQIRCQIEVNLVLQGNLTFWLYGNQLAVGAGQLAASCGIVPHQYIDREKAVRLEVKI